MTARAAPVRGEPRARADHGAVHAALVAAGILLSRVAGVVRQRVFAHFFGTSDQGDAFSAAIRIPNFLQNLFGEGVLSASFIPVYSSLLAGDEHEEADRLAGAIFALLALTVSILVLLGVLTTPALIAVIAPGFTGAKRDLTIQLVRILFPGAGFLALSAWCLGILNSHRKFFLSYTAPVAWNLVMIATLVIFGGRQTLSTLAATLAWGSVLGSAVQFAVQVPVVLHLVPRLRLAIDRRRAHVRTVVSNFAPVFVGRGVVQISAYVDALLASLLVSGSVAVMGYAQMLYLLPVSLFGMSIAASELPAMSSARGTEGEVHATLRARLVPNLRRIAFLIIPSAVAFLALGDVIAAAVYQSGRFTASEARWVWGTLAGSAVGLLASTLGRLYSSAFYALRDTRTPLRFAVARVALTIALGWLFAIVLPRALGLPPRWGTAGLTSSAGIAGWVEFALLRRALARRIGATPIPASYLASLWGAAAISAAAAWGVRLVLRGVHPLIAAVPIIGVYGGVYLAMTALFRVPEGKGIVESLARRRR